MFIYKEKSTNKIKCPAEKNDGKQYYFNNGKKWKKNANVYEE